MKPIHILLVEDNEGDILLTIEAFEERKITNKITVVKDGMEAIEFFNKTAHAALPDLVLLDINLPRKNGQEVLHFIKNNETFKQIPVIMLTTSSSETDIMQSYKNFANCYITKPVEVDSFLNVISQIENFWISIVTLPSIKTS